MLGGLQRKYRPLSLSTFVRRQQTQNSAQDLVSFASRVSKCSSLPEDEWPAILLARQGRQFSKKCLLSTIYGLILVPEGVRACNTVRFPSLHTCGNRRII